MSIIDSAFAQAIQDASGNSLEILILQTVQRWIDTELPPLLTAAEGALWQFTLGRIKTKLGSEPWMQLASDSVMKKIHAGMGERALQSLLQDDPRIMEMAQWITRFIQQRNAELSA